MPCSCSRLRDPLAEETKDPERARAIDKQEVEEKVVFLPFLPGSHRSFGPSGPLNFFCAFVAKVCLSVAPSPRIGKINHPNKTSKQYTLRTQ